LTADRHRVNLEGVLVRLRPSFTATAATLLFSLTAGPAIAAPAVSTAAMATVKVADARGYTLLALRQDGLATSVKLGVSGSF
jgi:hypothetical protein